MKAALLLLLVAASAAPALAQGPNEYAYKIRHANISSNPIGWPAGLVGISASYAITDNVVIKGDANRIEFLEVDGYELNATALFFFKRAYDGLFVEAGVMQRKLRSSDYDDCSDCKDSAPAAGPEVLMGWHWMFESGFNIAVALGAARNLHEKEEHADADYEKVMPAGYLRLGVAFD